jgi:hypothetical protein
VTGRGFTSAPTFTVERVEDDGNVALQRVSVAAQGLGIMSRKPRQSREHERSMFKMGRRAARAGGRVAPLRMHHRRRAPALKSAALLTPTRLERASSTSGTGLFGLYPPIDPPTWGTSSCTGWMPGRGNFDVTEAHFACRELSDR